MGQPKTDTERLEHLRDDATRACLEAGAIRQCDEHEDVFLSMQDEAADREAYSLGSAMAFDGGADATHNEMALAIADAIGSANLKCPMCETVVPIKASVDKSSGPHAHDDDMAA